MVAIAYSYKRSEKMQHTVDRLTLKAPVVGEIVKKATIARYAFLSRCLNESRRKL